MANKHKIKDNQRLFDAWRGMKRRCYSTQRKDYKYYGAKGVTVCDEWKHSFDSFVEWAYSHGYEDTLTIERIDNSKGYCPENCKWITKTEQQQNRTDKILIKHDGEEHNLKQWCGILGLNYTYIHGKYVKMRRSGIPITFDSVFTKGEDCKTKVVSSGKRGRKGKKVNQYDLNGNLVHTWDNVRSAVEAGFDQSSISRCCSGARGLKTTGGYAWEYVDE